MRRLVAWMLLLVSAAPALGQNIIVGWGGNSVSSTQNLNGFTSQTTLSGVNLNPTSRDNRLIVATDNSNNDAYIGIPFSTTTQLSPTSGYTGQRFFGGAVAGVLGTATPATIDRAEIANHGPNDSLDFNYALNGTNHDSHLVVYFDKTDFLNGGNLLTNQVQFGANSVLSVSFASNTSSQVRNDGEFRWVLRDQNNQWWISAKAADGRPNIRSQGDQGSGGIANNSTFSDSFANGDLTFWAPYNPTLGIGFEGVNFEPAYAPPLTPGAASYVIDPGSNPFTAQVFTDITALGLYIEGDQFATNIFQFEIGQIGFSVVVIPEPTTWFLLIGTPAVLGSAWYLRKRKKLEALGGTPDADVQEPKTLPVSAAV